MKLKFVLKDTEYLNALVKAIQNTDKRVFIDVGKDFDHQNDELLVTDISSQELKSSLKKRSLGGIVFLDASGYSDLCDDDSSGPFTLNKYSPVSEMLSDFRLCYYKWTGENLEYRNDAKLIGIFTDMSPKDSAFCSSLFARQYIYRNGGEALIIPLSHLDLSNAPHDVGMESFKKMIYYIEIGKKFPVDAFYLKDSYGVSYLRTPYGINPIAELDEKTMMMLVSYMTGSNFDIVILDAGCEYTKKNREIIGRAEHKLWLYHNDENDMTNIALVNQLFSDPLQLKKIFIGGGMEKLSLNIDEYLNEILEGGMYV